MSTLSRAAALGLATGGRSSFGLAALAASADRSAGSVWTGRWAARLAVLAAAGEAVGDKLPQTPSRLQPQGAIARLVLGGLGGAVLARRAGRSVPVTVLAAGTGLLAARAATPLGARWRVVGAARFGQDLPAALIEDVACLAVARYAVRG
ncbi:MAG: hypothetical protein ACR2N4_11810 [Jatrophihabitans sp.]